MIDCMNYVPDAAPVTRATPGKRVMLSEEFMEVMMRIGKFNCFV